MMYLHVSINFEKDKSVDFPLCVKMIEERVDQMIEEKFEEFSLIKDYTIKIKRPKTKPIVDIYLLIDHINDENYIKIRDFFVSDFVSYFDRIGEIIEEERNENLTIVSHSFDTFTICDND